jgi:hypothetical protein
LNCWPQGEGDSIDAGIARLIGSVMDLEKLPVRALARVDTAELTTLTAALATEERADLTTGGRIAAIGAATLATAAVTLFTAGATTFFTTDLMELKRPLRCEDDAVDNVPGAICPTTVCINVSHAHSKIAKDQT